MNTMSNFLHVLLQHGRIQDIHGGGGGGSKICFARTHITARRRHGIAQNLLRLGSLKRALEALRILMLSRAILALFLSILIQLGEEK